MKSAECIFIEKKIWKYLSCFFQKTFLLFIELPSYLSNLFASDRVQHKDNFEWGTSGLNSKFSFSKASCETKEAKEPSLPFDLIIVLGRGEAMPFSSALVWSETLIASSSSWTHDANSIFPWTITVTLRAAGVWKNVLRIVRTYTLVERENFSCLLLHEWERQDKWTKQRRALQATRPR